MNVQVSDKLSRNGIAYKVTCVHRDECLVQADGDPHAVEYAYKIEHLEGQHFLKVADAPPMKATPPPGKKFSVGDGLTYPSDHTFHYTCKLPKEVAELWLATIGIDPTRVGPERWLNKLMVVVRVTYTNTVGLYNHDGTYWLVSGPSTYYGMKCPSYLLAELTEEQGE